MVLSCKHKHLSSLCVCANTGTHIHMHTQLQACTHKHMLSKQSGFGFNLRKAMHLLITVIINSTSEFMLQVAKKLQAHRWNSTGLIISISFYVKKRRRMNSSHRLFAEEGSLQLCQLFLHDLPLRWITGSLYDDTQRTIEPAEHHP